MIFAIVRAILTACLLTLLHASVAAQPRPPRLDVIRARGHLTCGVWPKVEGFSFVDRTGRYLGFDVDICRAVAAAVFGDPEKVRFVEVTSVFAFLGMREIDMVSRRLTWGMSREQSGVLFGPITFYDGQTFLVPRSLKITRIHQLAGVAVCVEPKSLHESNLDLYMRERKVAIKKVLVAALHEQRGSFDRARCSAYSADLTELGAIRSSLPNPRDYDILDEQISKEPLAQLVRSDDPQFFGVLRWTANALILAEELGVTSSNVDSMLNSGHPEVRRLLGVADGPGPAVGLDVRWAYNVIRRVGNYAEVFARNVGEGSPIGLPRGLNRLWTAGGLLYAPPLQ